MFTDHSTMTDYQQTHNFPIIGGSFRNPLFLPHGKYYICSLNPYFLNFIYSNFILSDIKYCLDFAYIIIYDDKGYIGG